MLAKAERIENIVLITATTLKEYEKKLAIISSRKIIGEPDFFEDENGVIKYKALIFSTPEDIKKLNKDLKEVEKAFKC